MKIIRSEFDGVLLIEPRVFEDNRGFFFESFNRRTFLQAGIDIEFVQDNQSRSCRNTVRGLHYQAPPHAQDKLVQVPVGEIWDVVVDIRRGSPTFGKWASFHLSAEHHHLLLVPKGFAHGFCVPATDAEVQYKCSDFYAPSAALGLRWNDPALAIPWPVSAPVLSEQDAQQPLLENIGEIFPYESYRCAWGRADGGAGPL